MTSCLISPHQALYKRESVYRSHAERGNADPDALRHEALVSLSLLHYRERHKKLKHAFFNLRWITAIDLYELLKTSGLPARLLFCGSSLAYSHRRAVSHAFPRRAWERSTLIKRNNTQ